MPAGRRMQKLQELPIPPTGTKPGLARPRPGGRQASAAPSSGEGQQTLGSMRSTDPDSPGLIALAMPLLQLMARLRTMATQPDAAELRIRTESEIRAFETRAEKAGVPPEQLRRAGYALCASIDDLVLTTPWGAHGGWATPPLVEIFHPSVGPDRFFDVLRQAQEKSATLRPVLELMHVCLSLGVMSRYRQQPQGATEVEQIRAEAASVLANGDGTGALAARWQGVAMPFVARSARFPVWVAASIGVAAVAGLFVALSLRLNDRSDAVFVEALSATPSQMPDVTRQAASTPPPPAPPPVDPSAQDRLRTRLAPFIAVGAVAVDGTPVTPILRIPERALFIGSGAVVPADAAPLLNAIAEAMRPEAGPVDVVGYTDNRPVRTVLFPSSFQLTAARAQAVRAALARVFPGPRIRSEGRAGANPLASNATAEGREQNRRIEIVLDHAEP